MLEKRKRTYDLSSQPEVPRREPRNCSKAKPHLQGKERNEGSYRDGPFQNDVFSIVSQEKGGVVKRRRALGKKKSLGNQTALKKLAESDGAQSEPRAVGPKRTETISIEKKGD